MGDPDTWSSKRAVVIGPVRVTVKTVELRGMRRAADGSLVRVRGFTVSGKLCVANCLLIRPTRAPSSLAPRTVQDFDATDASRVALWPLQLIVDSVPAEDPRFAPRLTEPLAVRFPHQSSVVSVDQNVYSVVDPRTGTPQDARSGLVALAKAAALTGTATGQRSWGVAGAPTGRCYYGCTGRVVAVDERAGVLTVSFDHLSLDPPHLRLGDVIAAQYYEHKGYMSLKDVATRLRTPIWVVSCVRAASTRAPSGGGAHL